jgi:hypothetical protein
MSGSINTGGGSVQPSFISTWEGVASGNISTRSGENAKITEIALNNLNTLASTSEVLDIQRYRYGADGTIRSPTGNSQATIQLPENAANLVAFTKSVSTLAQKQLLGENPQEVLSAAKQTLQTYASRVKSLDSSGHHERIQEAIGHLQEAEEQLKQLPTSQREKFIDSRAVLQQVNDNINIVKDEMKKVNRFGIKNIIGSSTLSLGTLAGVGVAIGLASGLAVAAAVFIGPVLLVAGAIWFIVSLRNWNEDSERFGKKLESLENAQKNPQEFNAFVEKYGSCVGEKAKPENLFRLSEVYTVFQNYEKGQLDQVSKKEEDNKGRAFDALDWNWEMMKKIDLNAYAAIANENHRYRYK